MVSRCSAMGCFFELVDYPARNFLFTSGIGFAQSSHECSFWFSQEKICVANFK